MDIINADGLSHEGWPYSFGDYTFSGSPIIYDVDFDGFEDIINVDEDGIVRVSHVHLGVWVCWVVERAPRDQSLRLLLPAVTARESLLV